MNRIINVGINVRYRKVEISFFDLNKHAKQNIEKNNTKFIKNRNCGDVANNSIICTIIKTYKTQMAFLL